MKHKHSAAMPDIRLLPGERITNIEYITSLSPTEPPSELRQLYRLARARVENALYEFNPPLASLALEATSSTSSNLHRYEALFGRDALRVALDILPLYPQLTRATLVSLAKLQGTVYHTAREEEPGRIPHEVREPNDPTAIKLTKTRGWEWPYYGSVDSTPEFIRAIAAYCKQAPEGQDFLLQSYPTRNGATTTIAAALSEATDWILGRISNNKEGLLESKTSLPRGIENQVWKDSWDAYFHKDGTLANHTKGVASVEVQRLAYDALLDAAELYEGRHMGQPMYATELRTVAKRLKTTILKYFWTDDQGGYFVLGTDRGNDSSLRQLKVRTSNMGHLLHSRLLEGKSPVVKRCREAIVTQLFSPEMLAPSGIRTLASDEIRFRPGAYHNGSVWLWDTHFIAKGLRRHGYFLLANLLSERLFRIIDTTLSFPEFVRGDDSTIPSINTKIIDVWDETYRRINRVEQPPQQVQAWSVAAILALKHYNHMQHSGPQPSSGPFEQAILAQLSS